MIPMVDLKTQYTTIKDEIDQNILNALEACQFVLGPNVQAFEKEAAEYLGVQHAIGCNSGTDALHLALLAADIQPGDEIITTPFTFIATAEAIRYVGAIPVFVDIDENTFNINPENIEAAITPKTKAIMPVHIFGQPADMQRITTIADQHKLLIIEDCAQSFGADIENQMTGSIGQFGCYSFYPSKNLGCYGDGGLVTTNSDELADKLRVFRNHGSKQRYYHSVIGYNSRLDELQAVILRIKLKHINNYNQERRRVAHSYNNHLENTDIKTPHEDNIGKHVYHQYTCLTEQRDIIMQHLNNENIANAIFYPVPLHKQEAFAEHCQNIKLPIAEYVASHCMSLPIYPELQEQQIEYITQTIKKALS